MTAAMTALATLTLGSAQATVTFSSIPATYRDLRLVIDGTMSAGGTSIQLRYNSDTGSNYSQVNAYGSGSTPSTGSGSSTATSQEIGYVINADRLLLTADVMDYNASDKHKSSISRSNQPTGATTIVLMYAGRWASTSVITSLQVLASAGTFSTGSTFSLYGVSA